VHVLVEQHVRELDVPVRHPPVCVQVHLQR
jgi:hypothetical protein